MGFSSARSIYGGPREKFIRGGKCEISALGFLWRLEKIISRN